MIKISVIIAIYLSDLSCPLIYLWYFQKAVAIFIISRRSLALISLHRLRVPERIYFKLAVMTYRSIHGTSPSYLQSRFTRASDLTFRRRLRSSNSHHLDVPPVRLSTVGRLAFPVSGATVWNDLPLHVASAPSLAFFRRLKTFPFPRSYQATIIWLVCYYHHSSLLSGHLWSLQ